MSYENETQNYPDLSFRNLSYDDFWKSISLIIAILVTLTYNFKLVSVYYG